MVGPKVRSWSEPIQMRNLFRVRQLLRSRHREVEVHFKKGAGLPVRALDARRESRADSGSRADADAPLEHGGGVADASCRKKKTTPCQSNRCFNMPSSPLQVQPSTTNPSLPPAINFRIRQHGRETRVLLPAGYHPLADLPGTEYNLKNKEKKGMGEPTKLELASPHGPRRVRDQVLGEVPLHAADHVVAAGPAALADDAERVVLHDGGAADAPEEPLLHAALELEDGDFGGRLNAFLVCRLARQIWGCGGGRWEVGGVAYDFDFDGDLAEGHPGDEDAVALLVG